VDFKATIPIYTLSFQKVFTINFINGIQLFFKFLFLQKRFFAFYYIRGLLVFFYVISLCTYSGKLKENPKKQLTSIEAFIQTPFKGQIITLP